MSKSKQVKDVAKVTSMPTLLGLDSDGAVKQSLLASVAYEMMHTIFTTSFVADLNNIPQPGIFFSNPETSNAPASGGVVFQIDRARNILQFFLSTIPGQVYTRYYDASTATWKTWAPI